MRLPLILFLLLASSAAQAQNATQRAKSEALQYLSECPTSPKDESDYCRWEQEDFVWDYVSAKSGNYEDQRNVAFSLYHGVKGRDFIRIDVVQACAWQLYLTSTGNPKVTRLSLEVAGEVCNAIPDEAGHLVAAARAARIADDIRRFPARPLPPLKHDLADIGIKPCIDPKTKKPILDGTAYPLGYIEPPRKPGQCL